MHGLTPTRSAEASRRELRIRTELAAEGAAPTFAERLLADRGLVAESVTTLAVTILVSMFRKHVNFLCIL